MNDISELFDLDRLHAVLTAEESFRSAKTRLIRTLANPPRIILGQDRWAWLLGRRVSRLFIAEVRPQWTLDVPFGWTMPTILDMDCVRVMPLWIYWIAEARLGYWWCARALVRFGFLQGEEGSTFDSHHWTLRVWESIYARCVKYPLLAVGAGDKGWGWPWTGMLQRWYRFWLWAVADWRVRMPSWSDGYTTITLASSSSSPMIAAGMVITILGCSQQLRVTSSNGNAVTVVAIP